MSTVDSLQRLQEYTDTLLASTAGARSGFEAVMLSQEKLYVVLGVVLLIWAGIVAFLWHLERRTHRLEQELERLQLLEPENEPNA
ncbi:MAG: CcmD family protein [Bacteroidetes bacterium]|nr:CcmD family protein [Rhodothermia bacterium]MCS7154252.1 CcmD family protein [Bacteroidota bacterium]MCX7906712.1 CcmD family protein [Bacteroidota bacterium]MDW8137008.1 CcmD family protein [Bacteroidota bacterium]MDW8285121.1 CcmD family protein [Bacteroidota bacterium]